MTTYFWNTESFGDGYIPSNAAEVIDAANEIITAYIEANGLEEDSEEVEVFSDNMWEVYCRTGSYHSDLGDIPAE